MCRVAPKDVFLPSMRCQHGRKRSRKRSQDEVPMDNGCPLAERDELGDWVSSLAAAPGRGGGGGGGGAAAAAVSFTARRIAALEQQVRLARPSRQFCKT